MSARINLTPPALLAVALLCCVGLQAQEGILEIRSEGAISFVSGGVGRAEQEALKRLRPDFNLQLTFAHRGGAFLAMLPVSIADADGRQLLETVSRGPYFFARLPAGDYHITAEHEGEAQSRSINVPATGAATTAFYWSPPPTD